MADIKQELIELRKEHKIPELQLEQEKAENPSRPKSPTRTP